jgi:hypothetical protein
VTYADTAPWPAPADGDGASLQRRTSAGDPNDPAQWRAAAPTPGGPPPLGDTDGDGLPADWERAHGLDPNNPADALDDDDRDGLSNRAEYWAGTDPQDAGSALALRLAWGENTGWEITFAVAPGVACVLEASPTLDGSPWEPLLEVAPSDQPRQMRQPLSPAVGEARFFRLRATRP